MRDDAQAQLQRAHLPVGFLDRIVKGGWIWFLGLGFRVQTLVLCTCRLCSSRPVKQHATCGRQHERPGQTPRQMRHAACCLLAPQRPAAGPLRPQPWGLQQWQSIRGTFKML